MEAVLEAAAVRPRVAVVRVTVERLEGPVRDLDQPVTFEGPDALARAEGQLQAWAATAPRGGACDKCRYRVEWADGAVEAGRYELHHASCRGRDLAEEVRSEIGMRAGTWGPPAGVCAARWEAFRREMGYAGETERAARRFLETHAL